MIDTLPPILGEDPVFLDAVEKSSALATINRPCLVVGERGTGKELFAARLHYLSPRWNGPLVKVNCAALSEALLESELFGHEAGAFTGAQKRRTGRFEQAHSGTLILDEIANASPAVQEKILRVIEYGEFQRVGGTETIRVDARVVGSANVDLPTLVKAGDFRADLLDRLAFDVITIPPLRARSNDVMLLANNFALDISKDMSLDFFPGFSAHAVQALNAYSWPGNVRELRNVIERSIFCSAKNDTPINLVIIDPFESPWRPQKPMKSAQAIPNLSEPNLSGQGQSEHFNESVASYKITLLKTALSKTRHNQKDAAELLGLGYHQFRRLIQKYDLK